MNRRTLLSTLASACFGVAVLPFSKSALAVVALKKSKSEWKKILPESSYLVLFEEATERARSSPLDHEKRDGTYICAACNQPLFKSAHKYDSGTGWPSFFDVLPDAVEKRLDFKMVLPRHEYHCSRCGGHQGHVFDDGPKPSGLRYCNNGVALVFVPATEKLPELRA